MTVRLFSLGVDMYVNVRRRQAFFGNQRGWICHGLVRYDFETGRLVPSPGGYPDDMVEDVSRDGSRLLLLSSNWITVRGIHRNRISVVQDGAPIRETNRFVSWWCRFDPSGRYALVNTKKRPVVVEVDSGEFGDPIARDVDARDGDVDPVDGRLWAGDDRSKDTILSVDCRTGDIAKIKVRLGAQVARLRFAADGSSLFVAGRNGVLICSDRDGSTLWSLDFSDYGEIGGQRMLLNESGSHLCLPIPATKQCAWGEDLIISTKNGRIERSIIRHRGPPARLWTDWVGDCALTYTGEIVNFFTGEIVDELALPIRSARELVH